MRTQVLKRRVATLGVFLAFAATPAMAQLKISVNSTSDAAGFPNRSGICETAPNNGVCTLRAAIQISNAIAGSDSIGFRIPTSDPNYDAATGVYTIPLSTELPSISDSVQITGPGAEKLTVRQADTVFTAIRVITVTTGGSVTLAGLTIAGGIVGGGGIQNLNTGTVNLNNCAFRQNGTADPGGGAILNAGAGVVNVTNCAFTLNNASAFLTSANGGAVYNAGGTVNITNSTFFQNYGSTGAAVYNDHGTVTVIGSTFYENGASYGGALANGSGSMSITNSTLYANVANAWGGAIYNQSGALQLSNSTVTANFSRLRGSVTNGGGTASIKSSIIAQNFGAGIATTASVTTNGHPDVDGSFLSQGFNLIGKRDGSGGFTATTDKKGSAASPLNPKFDLKGLRNNGGPTLTIALQSSSPAIDKGTSLGLTGILSTDQRGGTFLRKVDKAPANATGGDGTDIGAYELQ